MRSAIRTARRDGRPAAHLVRAGALVPHLGVPRQDPHKFPNEHSDYLEQAIRYQVPPERFDDLAMFDGSMWAERTKGLLHARCDKEGLNMLAMNLAHEIVSGMRGVDEARQIYTENAGKFTMGTPTDYTQRLMFEPATGYVGAPDDTTARRNRPSPRARDPETGG